MVPHANYLHPLTHLIAQRIVALASVAFIVWMTLGGLIHPLLHTDADEANHDCAFVHWANGEVGFAQAGVSVAPTCESAWLIILLTVVCQPPSVPESARYARGPPMV